MRFDIQITIRDITETDLLNVYDMFCACYYLYPNRENKDYIEKEGLSSLTQQPYRLRINEGVGRNLYIIVNDNRIEFWPQIAGDHKVKEEQHQKFERQLVEYFD